MQQIRFAGDEICRSLVPMNDICRNVCATYVSAELAVTPRERRRNKTGNHVIARNHVISPSVLRPVSLVAIRFAITSG